MASAADGDDADLCHGLARALAQLAASLDAEARCTHHHAQTPEWIAASLLWVHRLTLAVAHRDWRTFFALFQPADGQRLQRCFDASDSWERRAHADAVYRELRRLAADWLVWVAAALCRHHNSAVQD